MSTKVKLLFLLLRTVARLNLIGDKGGILEMSKHRYLTGINEKGRMVFGNTFSENDEQSRFMGRYTW